MKKFNLIFGALSMLTVGSASADSLVLDSFNYQPSLALEVSSNINVAPTTATGTVTSAESGATADYTLNFLSGSGSDSVDGNVFGAGVLSYNEDSLADGDLLIEYSLGATTLDFTGYDGFYFDIVKVDGNGGFDFLLTLTDDDGTEISATYHIDPTLTPITFIAAFNSMMSDPDFADFDFAMVQAASTYITSIGTGDDFTLTEVGLVPEPSALAILGLGLLGLGLRHRKLV